MTFLRSGVLILAVLGASSAARAQVPLPSTLLEGTASQREHALQAAGGATAGQERSAALGPRRAVSFSSASLPLQVKAEPVAAAARIRPRTTGALIGGTVGGAIGFAAGYEFDNIERSGGRRVGPLTVVGAAGGILVGAIVGGAVGWLVER